jgi:hypothetical protein
MEQLARLVLARFRLRRLRDEIEGLAPDGVFDDPMMRRPWAAAVNGVADAVSRVELLNDELCANLLATLEAAAIPDPGEDDEPPGTPTATATRPSPRER